jgi:hypothetical protein
MGARSGRLADNIAHTALGVADADFLAVLEAVSRLRVESVAQDRPTRPTRA